MLHRVGYAALAVSIVALVAFALLPSASTVLTPDAAHAQGSMGWGNLKYTGTASCGASNCHGSTKPKPEYPRMNENIIWSTKDAHNKGYATLTNEKLKSGVSPGKMAKAMGIADATKSEKCLVCHAVAPPQNLRGPKFDITEGVGCDGCHGPAEKWLEGHAEKGWTHEKSVSLGMYDTKNFLLRAEKCVSCHLQIDAEMVKAGHPDLLAFELATFSSNMPPHWRDKGAFADAKAWATGQVISLREAARQLANRAKGTADQKLLDDGYAKVQGHGATVRHAVGADLAKTVEADITALGEAVKKGDKAAIQTTATKIATAMNTEAKPASTREYDAAKTKATMQAISNDAEKMAGAGIRGAEQAAMALDRLYNAYSKSPGQKADKAANDALDKIFAGIENPAKYDAKAFATDVKAFGGTLK
jgi:hypothetical protein